MTKAHSPNEPIFLKVVILGNAGIGKSCLMNRFVLNQYFEDNFQTIGADFMKKNIEVDGEKYTLQIWDTAGQERMRALRTPFYRGSDVCMLCYAINSRKSFLSLKYWHNEFRYYAKVNEDKFPFIVVGNKNDMSPQSREINLEQVQEWCAENGISNMIETSSKVSNNVTDAFILAVRQWKDMGIVAIHEPRQIDNIIKLVRDVPLIQDKFCCIGSERDESKIKIKEQNVTGASTFYTVS